MQRNIWPARPKWIPIPPPEKQATLAQYREWLSKVTADGHFFLLAMPSLPAPWHTAFHQCTALLSSDRDTAPQGKHLLALVHDLPSAGRLTLTADSLSMEGITLLPETASFLCTTFGHQECHTLRLSYNDLALPASPSPKEMEILALGLLGYSAARFPSLLAAVDEARKAYRCNG